MATIFIKGFGLIGSSLGRAIKAAHPTDCLIISDPNPATLKYAHQHDLADQEVDHFQGVSDADFVILAGPVSAIQDDLKKLATLQLKKNVIITDVGSTKQSIMAAARPLQERGITFIGGHPMAGSQQSGVQAGRGNLIAGAYYFQVCQPQDLNAAYRIQELLYGLDAHWLSVSAKKHDQIVAQLSHLPHIVAAALVKQTAASFRNDPHALELAAGGFKTITRIASSDPTVWTAILLNNRTDILEQLQDYINALQKVQQVLQDADKDSIFQLFSQAKQIRDGLKQADKR